MEIFTGLTVIGAAGYSLAYLLGGGGIIGAIAIYAAAKMAGR